MTWLQVPLLGFDTETTGVLTWQDRIVSAALVWQSPAGRVARTWLIDPGVEIPPGAAAVHGISTEYVRDHGVSPAPALDEIAYHIAGTLSIGWGLVAFNAPYDLAILEAELQRYRLPTVRQRLGREPAPVIDPLVLDRWLDRYRPGKRTLTDLCGVYGVAGSGLHAADVDVVATLDVLGAMAYRYPELAGMSAPALHTAQAQAHAGWARSFNEWLVANGRTGDVPESWP